MRSLGGRSVRFHDALGAGAGVRFDVIVTREGIRDTAVSFGWANGTVERFPHRLA